MSGGSGHRASPPDDDPSLKQQRELLDHESFMRLRTAGATKMEQDACNEWMWEKKQAWKELQKAAATAKGGSAVPAEGAAGEAAKGRSGGPESKKLDKELKHMTKILTRYGSIHGTKTATQQLLSLLAGTGYSVGVMCPKFSVEWTLCKHFFLTICGALPKPDPNKELVVCHCLPATAFMPAGCTHNKMALASPTVISYYPHTFAQLAHCA